MQNSPDTDVLILLIEMYQRLPVAAATSFTESDMSERFAGRSKDWRFKVFLKCDSKILDALGAFGQESDPSLAVCAQLERFVCLIYKSEVLTEVKDLGSCIRIMLLRERVLHLPLVHYSYTYGELTTSR